MGGGAYLRFCLAILVGVTPTPVAVITPTTTTTAFTQTHMYVYILEFAAGFVKSLQEKKNYETTKHHRLVPSRWGAGRWCGVGVKNDKEEEDAPVHLLVIMLTFSHSFRLLQMEKSEEQIVKEREEEEEMELDGTRVVEPRNVAEKVSTRSKRPSGCARRKMAKARRAALTAGEGGQGGGESMAPPPPPPPSTTSVTPTTTRSAHSFPNPRGGKLKPRVLARTNTRVGTMTLETPSSFKRQRGTPGSGDTRPRKRVDEDIRPLPDEGNLVQFVYRDDTMGRFSAVDYSRVMEGFRNAIDELGGSLLLRIGSVTMKNGVMEAECHDEATKLWVEGFVGTLLEGTLKTITCEEARARAPLRTVGVWVREKTAPQAGKFFKSLSVQNGGLDTSRWCIRCANPRGGGHFLLIGMGEESHSRIQPPARIYYYTDLLSFTFDPPPPKGGASEGGGK